VKLERVYLSGKELSRLGLLLLGNKKVGDVRFAGDLFVNTNDIVGDSLEVAGSIVRLGNMDALLLPVVNRLVERIHAPELLKDRSEVVETGLEFLLGVGGLDGGANQADINSRRSDLVGKRHTRNVNVCVKVS
jgi:hypothetical protein